MFTSFGETLKLLRKHKKMSQQQLAKNVGVHSNTISGWERGNNLPDSKGIVLELAHQLHLDEQETHQLLEASLTALAPYWQVPYQRNPFFTGREKVLHQLHETLKQEHTVILSQSYTLSGLGGIGKTQTAIEYAYRYANEYSAIFWVSAETRETIFSSYIAMADMLHLPEREQQDQEKVVVAVTRWLTIHCDWFIIFDNVEDPALVKSVLPATRCGSFLFTSRRQVLGLEAQTLGLEQMPLEEGMYFLLRRARLLDPMAPLDSLPLREKTLAQEIVSAMDGLPLALDQAGAYILETGCTLEIYQSLWQQRQRELLSRRGSISTEHPASVTMTFTLAFEWIQHKSQAAIELLKLCAFLAPDAIPEELFLQKDTSSESYVLTDSLVFNDALGVLRSLSLVRRNPATRTLSLHRLVQIVLRHVISESEQQQCQQQAIHLLATIFPEVTYETWGQCERLLSHVLTCVTNIQNDTEDLELAGLLLKTAFYLQERAQYTHAEGLLKRALHIREMKLGSEHLEVAKVLSDLARLYAIQGKFAQAEGLLKQALYIREQANEMEHPEVARMLNNLAAISYEQGQYEQARPLYEQALHLWKQTMGPEHPDVAKMLNNLALFYRNLGKYEQAQPLYEQAFHLWEKVFGPEHPYVANSLSGLANLFSDQGKYKQAQLLYEQILRIREKAQGSEHPEVAEALNNVGQLLYEQGQYKQAQPFFEQALHIWEQALGLEHPETVEAVNNLGLLSFEQGQYEQAQPFFEQALHIWEQALGPEHSEVAKVLNNVGLLSFEQGQYEQAQLYYERALHIWKQAMGPEHPKIARVLNNLAALYQLRGEYEQAQSFYEQALHIWEQAMGCTHPHKAYPLNGLAILFVEQCRYEEAEQFYKQALYIREQGLGRDHPAIAQTLHDLAVCFQKQGHLLEAISLFERALLIRSQSLGDSHPKTVTSQTRYTQLIQEIEHVEQESIIE